MRAVRKKMGMQTIILANLNTIKTDKQETKKSQIPRKPRSQYHHISHQKHNLTAKNIK